MRLPDRPAGPARAAPRRRRPAARPTDFSARPAPPGPAHPGTGTTIRRRSRPAPPAAAVPGPAGTAATGG